MGKKKHIFITIEEDGNIQSSYYLGKASFLELSLINAELEVVKKIIIEKMEGCQKSYEITEEEEDDSH